MDLFQAMISIAAIGLVCMVACCWSIYKRHMRDIRDVFDLNPDKVRVSISTETGMPLASWVLPTKTAFTYLLVTAGMMDEYEHWERQEFGLQDADRCGIGRGLYFDTD